MSPAARALVDELLAMAGNARTPMEDVVLGRRIVLLQLEQEAGPTGPGDTEERRIFESVREVLSEEQNVRRTQ